MRRFTLLAGILGIIAPTWLPAAPVPERKDAKPGIINAGAEKHIQWVQQRLVSCAHFAILGEKKVAELPTVRRHLRDRKDTKELISWLEKNFRVERVPDTKLVRVSFRDGKPEEQAAIINCVADYFLTNEVGQMRAGEMRDIEKHRGALANPSIRLRATAERLAKAEENLKKREEDIRKLPALVEPAKVAN